MDNCPLSIEFRIWEEFLYLWGEIGHLSAIFIRSVRLPITSKENHEKDPGPRTSPWFIVFLQPIRHALSGGIASLQPLPRHEVNPGCPLLIIIHSASLVHCVPIFHWNQVNQLRDGHSF
jgi:hypothetical protein